MISAPTENERTVTVMAEYIKRDEAIAALDKVRDDQRAFKYATASDFLSARDAIERAVKVLESLPAADVEPVRHGRWIKESDGGTRCSVCNKRVRDVREKLVELLKTNACPSPFICDPACRYYGLGDCFPERFADYLIAKGVTVQECGYCVSLTDCANAGVYCSICNKKVYKEGSD